MNQQAGKEGKVTCCITGSTGFVGRHITKELCSRGLKVRCLTRTSSDLAPLAGLPVEIYRGDITDEASLQSALQGVMSVVHLVAIIRETKEATFEAINLAGTRNLVQAAKKMGVKKLVFMSNLAAGPDKRFPLLYTKWQAEEEVKSSGIDFTIFRPSVMFGRGDGFVCVLADIIKRLPLVPIIGSGRTKFQLISVEDVATCVAESLTDRRTANQIITLGGPEHLTYEEIVDLIIEKLKMRRRKVHFPVSLVRTVIWIAEKSLLKLPITSAQLAMLTRDNVTDLNVVEKVFSFKPVPLREKIDDILR
jgi:uncharacterized protein YbjT (DUF2867 family)